MNSKFIELDGTIINVDEIAKVNLVENVGGQEHSLIVIKDKHGLTNNIEASEDLCEDYYSKLLAVLNPIHLYDSNNE